MWFKLAWRLFWRELQRGELWVIAFALFLAVTSVISLSGITQSVKSALSQRSAHFDAADKVLRSSQVINPDILTLASQYNLEQAQVMHFDSMLFAAEDRMQLVTVRAVTSAYPLRGNLILRRAASVNQGDYANVNVGEIWLEPRLFSLLGLDLGDNIELGLSQLTVAGVIETEPDVSFNLINNSPRVLMHLDDVAATGVVQPGSRISYRYLFAGNEIDLQRFEQATAPLLTVHQRWQQRDRESTVGSALERAESFLLLAGLLGITLAACAAAVAATRYSQRHTQSVAIMKALGATGRQARFVYGSHLFLVILFSGLWGILLGTFTVWLSQKGIQLYLDDYQAVFSWRPLWLGVLTNLICGILFVARPLWVLIQTPAIEVLKQTTGTWRPDWLQLVFGALAIWSLMWLFSGEFVLSIGLFLLCALFAALLLGAAALIVKLAKPASAGQSSASKLALANLRRRLWSNSFQLITFSMAIFLTLLLYFLRAELLEQWRQQIPEGAPNQFLVNISQQELEPLSEFAAQHQLTFTDYYPVVRGRLVAVNDEIFSDNNENTENNNAEPRREGVGRELNLTGLSQLPDNNQIISGNWFSDGSQAEVSVEQEMADRLQLRLGDQLHFSLGGQQITAEVTSIRSVDWNSLQPNFYMIFSPDVLTVFPATYLSAFYLSPEQTDLLNQLSRAFPTVTLITIDTIIKQVNDIIDQVTIALGFILLIIVFAAVLVMVAQVQSTMEQREQELAILRALGARYLFLRNALLLEFALLGAMAGFFATLLAEILLFALQQQVFSLEFRFHYTLWWMGPVIGTCFITLLGWWQIKRLLSIPGAVLIRRILS